MLRTHRTTRVHASSASNRAHRKAMSVLPSLWDGIYMGFCPSQQGVYDITGFENKHSLPDLTGQFGERAYVTNEVGSYCSWVFNSEGRPALSCPDSTAQRFVITGTESLALNEGAISIWVKPTSSTPANNKYFVGRNKSGDNKGDINFYHRSADGKAGFQFQDGAGSSDAALTDAVLSTTAFIHLLFTWNGTIGWLYRDGVQQTNGVTTAAVAKMLEGTTASLGDICIGHSADTSATTGGSPWPGDWDDFAMWRRYLLPDEVRSLYRLGRGGLYQAKADLEELATIFAVTTAAYDPAVMDWERGLSRPRRATGLAVPSSSPLVPLVDEVPDKFSVMEDVPQASQRRLPAAISRFTEFGEDGTPTFDPGNVPVWARNMDDGFLHRALATVKGAVGQERKHLALRLDNELPQPAIYSIYDTYDLTAFDGSQTTVAAAAAAVRAGASGDKGNKGGQGKDQKNKKWGNAAWIIGMEMPYTTGDSPYFGIFGTPDPETVKVFTEMRHMPRVDRFPPSMPFEGNQAPLFFGDAVEDIDWEPPYQHNLFRRRIVLSDYQVEADVPAAEGITLDKWYTRFPGIINRVRPSPLPQMDSFVNLKTEEDVYHVDRWYSPLSVPYPSLTKLRMEAFVWREVDQGEPENITLDKWYSPLVPPVFLGPRLVQTGWKARNYDPIINESQFEETLAFHRPFSQPKFLPHYLRLSLQSFESGELDLDEAVQLDKYDTILTVLPPWRPKMPIAAMPHRFEEVPSEPENITLDKWYSPLAFNFHRLPPAPLPVLESLPTSRDEEAVTMDKWYAMATAMEHYPYRALRAAKSPEPQDIRETVRTAPWLEFSNMDPNPIEDVPGVTYEFWFASLSLPYSVMRGSDLSDDDLRQFLALYYPHQDFPVEDAVRFPCESPRRRRNRRMGVC